MTFTVETIGDCTLYLGNSTAILPTLDGIDHVITDPPYGEGTHAQHDQRAARRSDGANAKALGYDALTEDDVRALAELLASKCDGWIVWMTNFDLAAVVKRALADVDRCTFPGLPFHDPGRSVRLAGDGPSSWTDWIMVARTAKLHRWGTLRGGYVSGPGWNDKARMGGKPTRLMELLVTDYSRVGDTVCDPFMGAGTTGVACVNLGRRFIGIEVDQAAFDLSCKRIDEAVRQPRLFAEPMAKPVQDQLFG